MLISMPANRTPEQPDTERRDIWRNHRLITVLAAD
jgi:hypothetical protein